MCFRGSPAARLQQAPDLSPADPGRQHAGRVLSAAGALRRGRGRVRGRGSVSRSARTLGVQDVRAVRVLAFESVYWVYVVETGTGRPAFSLAVDTDGDVKVREFPAMDPEMMWNQKYGHQARPNAEMIETDWGAAGAAERVRQALPTEGKLDLGKVSPYFGYFLFPLCEGDRQVGEAAVDAVQGKTVWKRFPEPPRSTWVAPGAGGRLCE